MPRNNHKIEKPKNMKNALIKLASYCKKQMGVIVFALVIAVIGAVLTILGPDQISKITDYMYDGITGKIDMEGIAKVGIFLLTIYLISALCSFLQNFIMATVTQIISKRLRGEIDRKINRLPFKYFSDNSYGDVLSRVTNDVDLIGQAMSNSIASMVSAAAQFIGCLIMMYYTNWIMASTTVLTTIIGLVLMALIMSHSQKFFATDRRV